MHPYNATCVACRDPEDGHQTLHNLGSHIENLPAPPDQHVAGGCNVKGCECPQFRVNGLDVLMVGLTANTQKG